MFGYKARCCVYASLIMFTNSLVTSLNSRRFFRLIFSFLSLWLHYFGLQHILLLLTKASPRGDICPTDQQLCLVRWIYSSICDLIFNDYFFGSDFHQLTFCTSFLLCHITFLIATRVGSRDNILKVSAYVFIIIAALFRFYYWTHYSLCSCRCWQGLHKLAWAAHDSLWYD